MNIDLISRKEARELLYKRLYETALNNVGACMDGIEEVYQDIADNRLDTWISEIPPADEIKVGDEVYRLDINYPSVVTCIFKVHGTGDIKAVSFASSGKVCVDYVSDLHKTGRHFPQIEEVLKQMKERE